jgi:hypothetical protein
LISPAIILGVFAHQAELGRDRAAHADDAGEAMVGLKPVENSLWCIAAEPKSQT